MSTLLGVLIITRLTIFRVIDAPVVMIEPVMRRS
jgi:hypothetical protein